VQVISQEQSMTRPNRRAITRGKVLNMGKITYTPTKLMEFITPTSPIMLSLLSLLQRF
jgi:hypothetical protein